MAVAFVRQAKNTGTTSPLGVTLSAGAASGNVLVAFISSNRGASTARTVTGITTTNTTWAVVGTQATGSLGTEIWYGIVAGGTSGTAVSITFSGTVASGCSAIVAEFSGVLVTGTTLGNAATKGTGTSTSPTANFTPLQADSLVVGAVGYSSGTAPSADTSWTDLTVSNANTDTAGGAYLTPVTTIAQQTASWTIGNVAWAVVIGELRGNTLTLSVLDSPSITESVTFQMVAFESVFDNVTSITENVAMQKVNAPSVFDSDSLTENINVFSILGMNLHG